MFNLDKDGYETVENPRYETLTRGSEILPAALSLMIVAFVFIHILWLVALGGSWVFFQHAAIAWLVQHYTTIAFTFGIRFCLGIFMLTVTVLVFLKVTTKETIRVKRKL